MSSHHMMPVSRSNEERSVLYSLNLMYESNLRRARALTQGRLTIKFAVCESEEWATGDGRRRICRWGVWWWFTISHFSIINAPLSLWTTSEEEKSATGLFTSSAVLMDVKPDGPPGLTGDLQLYYDISAGISRKRRFSICNLDLIIYNQLGTITRGAFRHTHSRQWIIILFAVRFLTTRCHWILCAGHCRDTPRYKTAPNLIYTQWSQQIKCIDGIFFFFHK